MEATRHWLHSSEHASSISIYTRALSWWLDWVHYRGLFVDRVDPSEVDLYVAALHHSQLSDATTQQRLSVISSWYGYLAKIGLIVTNPFKGARCVRGAAKSTRRLTEANLLSLAASAVATGSLRTVAIVTLLITTASQTKALLDARVDDLGNTGDIRTLRLANATTLYPVPLAPYSGQRLDAYLARRGRRSGPLFTSSTGLALSRSYVYELVRGLAQSARIADPHSVSLRAIRSSVARAHLEAGESIESVRVLLGHAETLARPHVTTEAYLAQSPAFRLNRKLERQARSLPRPRSKRPGRVWR
ncbi:site-specific integrase [Nonomuraea sp. NPDC050310]|uniref:tyrosine-type recombinase/integrase n=1 Tax=Nonomuraea sp. NPDC050310 TaxID=3154935 RepID=UPI0033EAD4F4